MSDTRQVLARISAFRARLEEVPRLVPFEDEAGSNGLALPVARLNALATRDAVVTEPSQLTGRAYRLLTDARQLVEHQRQLTTDPLIVRSDESDPLAKFHRGTINLTESALRLVQVFPAAAESQLRMCDGFEHLLQVIRGRLALLEHALSLRRADASRIERLANLLSALQNGKPVAPSAVIEIAEVILDDARQGARLRVLSRDPAQDGVAAYVAAHAITVAQVLARVVPHDYEWAMKPVPPLVAALVMDAGMLDVPVEILAKGGALTADERSRVERHPLVSGNWVRSSIPDFVPIVAAMESHHERLDGSGYVSGQKAEELATLSRLLAVADGYAARMADRPYRAALDPRAALTDTLLEAEAGRLDRDMAEYLLHLSFHPLGTVVELTDGRLAVVAATHNSRTNLRASMRPVVAVLANARGDVLPRPEFLDLAATEVGSIVRSVPAAERREKLGEWYPDLCV